MNFKNNNLTIANIICQRNLTLNMGHFASVVGGGGA